MKNTFDLLKKSVEKKTAQTTAANDGREDVTLERVLEACASKTGGWDSLGEAGKLERINSVLESDFEPTEYERKEMHREYCERVLYNRLGISGSLEDEAYRLWDDFDDIFRRGRLFFNPKAEKDNAIAHLHKYDKIIKAIATFHLEETYSLVVHKDVIYRILQRWDNDSEQMRYATIKSIVPPLCLFAPLTIYQYKKAKAARSESAQYSLYRFVKVAGDIDSEIARAFGVKKEADIQ